MVTQSCDYQFPHLCQQYSCCLVLVGHPSCLTESSTLLLDFVRSIPKYAPVYVPVSTYMHNVLHWFLPRNIFPIAVVPKLPWVGTYLIILWPAQEPLNKIKYCVLKFASKMGMEIC